MHRRTYFIACNCKCVLFSHAMKLLGLIRTLTFSFSTIDTLLMLHFILVRSRVEYGSVALNPVTITDSNKLERVQRNVAALCHKRLGVVTLMHCF
jgi:hypothetical protein